VEPAGLAPEYDTAVGEYNTVASEYDTLRVVSEYDVEFLKHTV
jgi:hypothetical protein